MNCLNCKFVTIDSVVEHDVEGNIYQRLYCKEKGAYINKIQNECEDGEWE